MLFTMGEPTVILQGDPSLCNSLISLKAMIKAIREEGEGILLELCTFISSEKQDSPTAVSVLHLLQQNTDVFAGTKALPPARAYDHAITLQLGTRPINVRPYRYPHHQKNEIERMVRDMLHIGIVQPSISPFSSLVLLVKKKDGGGNFVSTTEP